MKLDWRNGYCMACGSDEFRILFDATDRLYQTTKERFRVVACSGCGLMRLLPQPSPEEAARFYPKTYWFRPDGSVAGRLEEAYRRVVLRDHVGFVQRVLRDSAESGPVLDVGCGGGLFLGMLRERGFRVIGLDISPDAAAVAWKRQGVPALCGSLADCALEAESCAAVTMFHVLEHLHDPRVYLNAAHRLLRPGGRLIVQVPNAACWQFRLLGSRWNGVDVPRHLFDFREADLEHLLEVSGFEILRRKYFSLRDNPAGLASSISPGLDPMARRVRPGAENLSSKLLKDAVYFALLAAAAPFTMLEAACRAGSTIMVAARKKP